MTNARGTVHYRALIVLFATVLLGCAALEPPAGDPTRDAELKKFTVPRDKAGLFVYRNESFRGPPSTIDVDGQDVGRTDHMTYVYVELPPGRHSVRTSNDTSYRLQFEAGAGTITYVWEEVAKIDTRRGATQLHLVNEAEGRKGVLETRLTGEPYVLKPVVVPPVMQTLQVRVEVDGAPVTDPIDCEATNDLGRWMFSAPGPLTVQVSAAPLHLLCKPSEDLAQEQATLPPREPTTRQDSANQGVKTGAIVGTTVGVGLAVASFPFFGPAGALFVLGGAVRGAEVGGIVGALVPEQPRAYPDPIVVRLTRTAGKTEGVPR